MASITPGYELTVGEDYDPVLLMAIFNSLTIGAILGADIAAGSILGSNIATGTISGSNIAAATITGTNIQADAIGASHIASNTISADDIQTDAITSTKIKAGAITTDKIYAGAITADKMSVTSLDAISANLGEVTSGIITAATVRTSANPSVNRVIMDAAGLRGYDDVLGLVFNIYTDGTPPLFSSGTIQSCTIIDTSIRTTDFRTSDVLPWVEITASGLALRVSGTGGLYGTAKYGTDTYGAGVTAYVGNSSKPFVSIETERTIADIRLVNRSGNPSGAAAVGDLACVNGKLVICTGAGTPGTWTVVGGQS
jgi:hypothetical protein